MMLLLGVVVIISMFLWRNNSRTEWSIPLRWQAIIMAWKEGLSRKTLYLQYHLYLGEGSCELEEQFWQLKTALPALQKKLCFPFWIEVCVYLDRAFQQKETYISCLQRRFSAVEIKECHPKGSNDTTLQS